MKSVFTLAFDGPKESGAQQLTPYEYVRTSSYVCKNRAFESLEDVYDFAIAIFENAKAASKGWTLLHPITMSMYDSHTYFVYAEYRNEQLDEETKEIVSFIISRYHI